MNILREPSRTHMASDDPPLEFTQLHSIMVYWSNWSQPFLHSQVSTNPDSLCWEVRVSKLLAISPRRLHRITGAGIKKKKNTERDWTGDQGGHVEHPSSVFRKSLSQFSNPFLPQQDRNRDYKVDHINYTQPFLTQNNCNLSKIIFNLYALQKHKAKQKFSKRQTVFREGGVDDSVLFRFPSLNSVIFLTLRWLLQLNNHLINFQGIGPMIMILLHLTPEKCHF